MLRFIDQVKDTRVLSLRNGRTITSIDSYILDPDKLKIVAFYVRPLRSEKSKILFSEDIRDLTPKGAIVDSEDNIMEDEDLVRLKKLIEIDFEIIGKKVLTTRKRKVGKVANATFDDKTYLIEKVYVSPPLLKTLNQSDLIISRRQIVEVNDYEIIVKDVEVPKGLRSKIKLSNPLSSQAQPEYPNT